MKARYQEISARTSKLLPYTQLPSALVLFSHFPPSLVISIINDHAGGNPEVVRQVSAKVWKAEKRHQVASSRISEMLSK